jgi:hypothetical protein
MNITRPVRARPNRPVDRGLEVADFGASERRDFGGSELPEFGQVIGVGRVAEVGNTELPGRTNNPLSNRGEPRSGHEVQFCSLGSRCLSGHPEVRPASGSSSGWAMTSFSQSNHQSPAGPASQPPTPNKLSMGGWEVKNWWWDREKQKREKTESKSRGGDGCCS